MHKICEPSFKNNYNPLLSSSCRHPLPWILTVVSNWIKWHASLRIEKKTGNFYLFFICFDAKMSFMFFLTYCHDLGYEIFVPIIMIPGMGLADLLGMQTCIAERSKYQMVKTQTESQVRRPVVWTNWWQIWIFFSFEVRRGMAGICHTGLWGFSEAL